MWRIFKSNFFFSLSSLLTPNPPMIGFLAILWIDTRATKHCSTGNCLETRGTSCTVALLLISNNWGLPYGGKKVLPFTLLGEIDFISIRSFISWEIITLLNKEKCSLQKTKSRYKKFNVWDGYTFSHFYLSHLCQSFLEHLIILHHFRSSNFLPNSFMLYSTTLK